MTPTAKTSSKPRNATQAGFDHAKRLAATLLSERSEASGGLVAGQLHGG
jgi:hypothetical protein